MIEGAGGVFTGSRYKDLQIQMYGKFSSLFILVRKKILSKKVTFEISKYISNEKVLQNMELLYGRELSSTL